MFWPRTWTIARRFRNIIDLKCVRVDGADCFDRRGSAPTDFLLLGPIRRLIPAAGMSEKDGAIECEAGSLECTGHRWQACVIDKDRDDVVKYLGNIAVRASLAASRTRASAS